MVTLFNVTAMFTRGARPTKNVWISLSYQPHNSDPRRDPCARRLLRRRRVAAGRARDARRIERAVRGQHALRADEVQLRARHHLGFREASPGKLERTNTLKTPAKPAWVDRKGQIST